MYSWSESRFFRGSGEGCSRTFGSSRHFDTLPPAEDRDLEVSPSSGRVRRIYTAKKFLDWGLYAQLRDFVAVTILPPH
jgi:hypothetical protein